MSWFSKYPEGKILFVSLLTQGQALLTLDQFITLKATFLASIISLPLPLLAALPTPIREVSFAERKKLAAPRTENDDTPRGPRPVKEVWRLLEYLMASGAGVPNLWLANVEMDEILSIVEVGSSPARTPPLRYVVPGRQCPFSR